MAFSAILEIGAKDGWNYEISCQRHGEMWQVTALKVKHDSPTIGSEQEVTLACHNLTSEQEAGWLFKSEYDKWAKHIRG